MLSEMLYKLRGMDKWPTTKATVTSTKIGSGYLENWNTILFTYVANQGSSRQGKLVADDRTMLFGISVTDTFDVKYDPRKPERIYCEEARPAGRDVGIVVLCLGAVFIVYQILAAAMRGAKH